MAPNNITTVISVDSHRLYSELTGKWLCCVFDDFEPNLLIA